MQETAKDCQYVENPPKNICSRVPPVPARQCVKNSTNCKICTKFAKNLAMDANKIVMPKHI